MFISRAFKEIQIKIQYFSMEDNIVRIKSINLLNMILGFDKKKTLNIFMNVKILSISYQMVIRKVFHFHNCY